MRRRSLALLLALAASSAALVACGPKVVEPAEFDLAAVTTAPAPSGASASTGSRSPSTTAGGGASPSTTTTAPAAAKSDGILTFLDITAPAPPSGDALRGPAIEVDGVILAFGVDDAASPQSFEPSALWSSTDQGTSWQRIGRSIGVPGGDQLVADVIRIGSRLVAVGSDESTNRTGDTTVTDAAVWASDDRGSTWRSVGQALFANRPGAQQMTAIRSVGDRLVAVGYSVEGSTAATANALAWLSDDRGETWRETAIDARPGFQVATAMTVAGARLIAGGSEDGTTLRQRVVWVSDDRGETWSRVTSPAFAAPTNSGLATIATVGSNLLAVATPVTDTPISLVSADGGATWRTVSSSTQAAGGAYRSMLVVDTRVYLAASAGDENNNIALLWYSDALGSDWKPISRQHIFANGFQEAGAILRTASGKILVFGRIDRADASDIAVASLSVR